MHLKFIMCPSFHGATALSFVLNNHTEISCLGDTLPPRNYDAACACGHAVSECGFWTEISRELDTEKYAGQSKLLPIYPIILNNNRMNIVLNKIIGKLIFAGMPHRMVMRPFRKSIVSFSRISQQFYDSVCRAMHTNVFVDSKKPVTSIIAQQYASAGIVPSVIHIIRDPRAYYNSYKKHYPEATLEFVCRGWTSYHSKIDAIKYNPYSYNVLSVKHEDMCRAPEATLKRVFSHLGIDYQDVFHKPDNPRKNHLIGNVGTLKNFDGKFRYDNRWINRVSKSRQREILELTYPLSEKYGYTQDSI